MEFPVALVWLLVAQMVYGFYMAYRMNKSWRQVQGTMREVGEMHSS